MSSQRVSVGAKRPSDEFSVEWVGGGEVHGLDHSAPLVLSTSSSHA